MKNLETYVMVEVATNNIREGTQIPHKEYNTRDGLSVIPNEVRPEIWRRLCRPHGHPNAHTEAELKLIRDMRHRNLALGLVELWRQLRKRGCIRCEESLYRVMRKLDMFPTKEKKKKYAPSLISR